MLFSNNIQFNYQETIDIGLIRHIFDFIVNNKYIIEYDGIQHFKPIDYFGGIEAFELQKEKDKLKDQYAKENNLIMIRIPYTYTTPQQISTFLNKYFKINVNELIDYESQILETHEILNYYTTHSLNETTSKFNCSSSSIMRNFKKIFGMNKMEYLKKESY